MIITVTLNAAIDRSLVVPNIRPGSRHHTATQSALPGGKGVNVARALKALGHPVIATGFAGGSTGTRVVEELTKEAILNDFVRIGEESRTNTVIFDPSTGIQTEINEPGPQILEAEFELFKEKLLFLARGAEIVVIAGSLPPSLPTDAYRELLAMLDKVEVATYLDTDGEAMLRAIEKKPQTHTFPPQVITPNQLEAEYLVGHEFNDDADRANAVKEICQLGAEEVFMTLPDGCIAVPSASTNSHAQPPQILRAYMQPRDLVSSVGSGDAFLAGLIAARQEGKNDNDALAFAVACGVDSTGRLGAGNVNRSSVEKFEREVSVTEFVVE